MCASVTFVAHDPTGAAVMVEAAVRTERRSSAMNMAQEAFAIERHPFSFPHPALRAYTTTFSLFRRRHGPH